MDDRHCGAAAQRKTHRGPRQGRARKVAGNLEEDHTALACRARLHLLLLGDVTWGTRSPRRTTRVLASELAESH